jgi:hypothetical protein
MSLGLEHTALFRDCLVNLDVAAMRSLWKYVAPHLPQPKTDDECLNTMHLARLQMTTLPKRERAYSQAWVDERRLTNDVFAVGIAVKAESSPNPSARRRGVYVRHEMTYAVEQALRYGIGLERPEDAVEVKRLIMLAREKA